MAQSPSEIIPCDIKGCDLPAATITDLALVIINRHHGERHAKTITRAELLRLLTEQSDTKVLTVDGESVLSCASTAQSRP